MALSLVTISVVAAGALAGVYILTLETINAQKKAKQEKAVLAVLPQGATIAEPETVNGLTVYKAFRGDKWVGTAVETQENGFGGPQKIMVGFDAEGKVINYEVLEHQETPGLGDHIAEWFKNADKPGQNIIGRKATGAFSVSKDGGDVDAITAATISSRAFLSAINKAYSAYTKGEVQAATGASQLSNDSTEMAEINVETEVTK
ncbi:MAG: RnfABCDGE type electron transport complex subunit G [Paludibacteraceae bacterium]|nr:RnfABCDGE type electron transport complex subunit G [Paludibacteraceae bacterium]